MKRSVLLLLALFTLPVSADVDSEQRELQLVQAQLGKLDYLITRAEREADFRQRRQFDYEALRLDIRTMQSGIHAYLNPERLEPKPIEPISGDYSIEYAHE